MEDLAQGGLLCLVTHVADHILTALIQMRKIRRQQLIGRIQQRPVIAGEDKHIQPCTQAHMLQDLTQRLFRRKIIKQDPVSYTHLACGLRTDAHGIILSLPVDEVIGLETGENTL